MTRWLKEDNCIYKINNTVVGTIILLLYYRYRIF